MYTHVHMTRTQPQL